MSNMKTSMTLALGVALVSGAVWANRIVVTQDRESALYVAGEEAKFSVSVAAEHGLRVIPVGTAVQLWRNRLPVVPKEGNYGGDVVGQGKGEQHLNPHGDYLQALVWTAKLFGVDVTKCPFAPDDLAPEKAALMRRVAADAVNGADAASASNANR